MLLNEVIDALKPKSGKHYLDGTLGGGGHSEAILEASHPQGFLFGCDQDGTALCAARQRLARFGRRVALRQINFANLDMWLKPESIDGGLLDLGVNAQQFETAERGFSLRHDGPLDMRMDERVQVTAADFVNAFSEKKLAEIFFHYGGESRSKAIAHAIVIQRRKAKIQTTFELARLIESVISRKGKRHPATKVFQALRILVNDELSKLERGLAVLWSLLRKGGRLAVITFHSAEARLVKHFGRIKALDYQVDGELDLPELRHPKEVELKWLEPKVRRPTRAEVLKNPRSRSAQLRVWEKL